MVESIKISKFEIKDVTFNQLKQTNDFVFVMRVNVPDNVLISYFNKWIHQYNNFFAIDFSFGILIDCSKIYYDIIDLTSFENDLYHQSLIKGLVVEKEIINISTHI